jgi:hypothetical protein
VNGQSSATARNDGVVPFDESRLHRVERQEGPLAQVKNPRASASGFECVDSTVSDVLITRKVKLAHFFLP